MTTIDLVRTPNVDKELLGILLAYKRELSDEQIAEMLETMQPVVRRDGELFYIKSVDPRKVSFTWGPTTTKKATGLLEIARIYTLHTWGYYGFFKPSLEEVLSMIPMHLITNIKAFEINGPKDVHDLNRQNDAVDAGYHVAVVTLYGDAHDPSIRTIEPKWVDD